MRDETVRVSSLRMAAACLLGLPLALVACYPGEITSVAELDLVVTKYVTDYDFQQNRTYFMPDTVVHILDLDDGEGDDVLTREFDALILQTVADNLDSLGYERIILPEGCTGDCAEGQTLDCNGQVVDCPDVGILVSAVGIENYQAWVSGGGWWGGWGWYPGWGYWPGYGPGWGVGYPPGGVAVTSFSVGSVFVDMWDPNNQVASASDTLGVLPAVWVGGLNGPLEGADQGNRLTGGLNQMFTQSPYLKVN